MSLVKKEAGIDFPLFFTETGNRACMLHSCRARESDPRFVHEFRIARPQMLRLRWLLPTKSHKRILPHLPSIVPPQKQCSVEGRRPGSSEDLLAASLWHTVRQRELEILGEELLDVGALDVVRLLNLGYLDDANDSSETPTGRRR